MYGIAQAANDTLPENCLSHAGFITRGNMRFGKSTGWGLVALGVLLVLLQFGLISMPATDRKASPSLSPPVERKIIFLPSVLGGVCVVVGAALVFSSKAHPADLGSRPR